MTREVGKGRYSSVSNDTPGSPSLPLTRVTPCTKVGLTDLLYGNTLA